MREALLEVRDLRTTFRTPEGPARVVDGLSLRLEEGETLGLVGESGCGKSAAALSIARLLPDRGARIASGSSVRLRGEELLAAPEERMRRVRGGEIAMVFQEPMTSLNPLLPVGEQVAEVLRAHRELRPGEVEAEVTRLLGRVGLRSPAERRHSYPHQLSGGMRQRAMIAMALAGRPSLLIADEPTTAVDVTVQARILELLASLQREFGMAMLLISHDLRVVAATADRAAVMYAGRIVEEGPVPALFREPRHPYTEGLLAAAPGSRSDREALASIDGEVPHPARWPAGCRFHPRCPHAWERCRRQGPVLTESGSGRARCWLLEEPGRRLRAAGSGAPPGRRTVAKGGRAGEGVPPGAGGSDSGALLEARELHKTYRSSGGRFRAGGRPVSAVRGVSLRIRRGETLALVGESGCGKTTTGRMLLGLERPSAGSVIFGGRDIAGLTRRERRAFRRRAQIVFQDPFGSLNPRVAVGRALREVLRAHGRARGPAAGERVGRMLERVGLSPGDGTRFPHELSGGQRQRVCIARALILRPEFLVADEPVSALDVSVQARILNLLSRLRERLGLTCVLIAHDLAVVRHFADRVAVMRGGRIVERDATARVFARPEHPYTRQLLDAAIGSLGSPPEGLST